MLNHVRRVDRINRFRGKGKPMAHIQPDIDLVERISVNIYETGQVFLPTAQMQMQIAPAIGGADRVEATQCPIIGQRRLRDSEKTKIFVALMKQAEFSEIH